MKAFQDLKQGASSAWGRNVLASLRISLVRRNSLTSRSRTLMRSRSAVLTPSRSPRATLSRLTHFSSICGVQPIIGAIDSTAAHINGCSLGCSCTSAHCARSDFRGKLAWLLVHGSLLKSWALHKTRRGSRISFGDSLDWRESPSIRRVWVIAYRLLEYLLLPPCFARARQRGGRSCARAKMRSGYRGAVVSILRLSFEHQLRDRWGHIEPTASARAQ